MLYGCTSMRAAKKRKTENISLLIPLQPLPFFTDVLLQKHRALLPLSEQRIKYADHPRPLGAVSGAGSCALPQEKFYAQHDDANGKAEQKNIPC